MTVSAMIGDVALDPALGELPGKALVAGAMFGHPVRDEEARARIIGGMMIDVEGDAIRTRKFEVFEAHGQSIALVGAFRNQRDRRRSIWISYTPYLHEAAISPDRARALDHYVSGADLRSLFLALVSPAISRLEGP